MKFNRFFLTTIMTLVMFIVVQVLVGICESNLAYAVKDEMDKENDIIEEDIEEELDKEDLVDTLRVGLLHGDKVVTDEVEVEKPGDYLIGFRTDDDDFEKHDIVRDKIEIKWDDNEKLWKLKGESLDAEVDNDHPLVIKPDTGNPNPMKLKNNERRYRGELELKVNEDGEIIVINVVELEDYLKGVVPAEVYVKWEMEALKAQAVAARSYALFSRDRNMGRYDYFDLTDDTESQVYAGYDREYDRTNEAVKATSGELVTNEGNIINALYHSNAGGYTEAAENVWGSEIGYLKQKESPWDEIALEEETAVQAYEWEVTRTAEEISEVLNEEYDIGDLKDIEILERNNETGRVLKVKYIGDKGEEEIMGDFNREPLGLRSTNFEIVTKGKNSSQDGVDRVSDLFILSKREETIEFNQGEVYVIEENGERKALGENYYVEGSKDVKTAKSETSAGRVEEFVFKGKGFGHGTGMSQWGAQGKALEGYDYEEILKYYYTGDIEITEIDEIN